MILGPETRPPFVANTHTTSRTNRESERDAPRAEPLVSARPRTIDEVGHLVRTAESAELTLATVGAAWSPARPDASPGMLVRMDGMVGVDDPDELGQVRVLAGTRIADLLQHLRTRGLTLASVPANCNMTIGGAVATSTHGSGLGAGPLSDEVVSVDMVVGGGRALRVEPASWEVSRGTCPPNLTLVRDDDVFRSVVTSLGAMGVVSAVTLRTVPDYVLEERRDLSTYEDLRALLSRPSLLSMFRDIAVQVNPYRRHRRHLASVTRIRRAPVVPPRRARHNLTTRALDRMNVGHWAGAALAFTPRLAPLAIDSALRALAGASFTGWSAEVLGGAPISDVGIAHAFEASVPVEDVVPCVDALLELAERERSQGRFLKAPITVRFVGASRHWLSPQYDRVSAAIEVISLIGGPDSGVELTPFMRLCLERGARMHFGLETRGVLSHPLLLANIPELRRWRTIAERLDPRRTFVHRMIADLGLR
ncbi:MAG: FAD-binding protein [Polyangiaceae bacterium]